MIPARTTTMDIQIARITSVTIVRVRAGTRAA
jgi:hypothetical protein